MTTVVLSWLPAIGRTAQRAAVESHFGPVTRLCGHCGSAEHGRPRIAGSHLSISYTDAGVLVALADGPVGVDIEASRDETDVAAWTRIEAILKLHGTGLRRPPDDVGSDTAEGVHTTTFARAGHWISVAVAAEPARRARDAAHR